MFYRRLVCVMWLISQQCYCNDISLPVVKPYYDYHEVGDNLNVSCGGNDTAGNKTNWNFDRAIGMCQISPRDVCQLGFDFDKTRRHVLLTNMTLSKCGIFHCGGKKTTVKLIERIRDIDFREGERNISVITSCLTPGFSIQIRWYYIYQNEEARVYEEPDKRTEDISNCTGNCDKDYVVKVSSFLEFPVAGEDTILVRMMVAVRQGDIEHNRTSYKHYAVKDIHKFGKDCPVSTERRHMNNVRLASIVFAFVGIICRVVCIAIKRRKVFERIYPAVYLIAAVAAPVVVTCFNISSFFEDTWLPDVFGECHNHLNPSDYVAMVFNIFILICSVFEAAVVIIYILCKNRQTDQRPNGMMSNDLELRPRPDAPLPEDTLRPLVRLYTERRLNYILVGIIDKIMVHVTFTSPILTTRQDRNIEPNCISFKGLFSEGSRQFRNIYICGESGVGKTSLCKDIVAAWCSAHSSPQSTSAADVSFTLQDEMEMHENEEKVSIMRQFDYLFYIKLIHAKKEYTIEDMIFSQILNNTEYQREDVRRILHSDKCLVVLDGLDEWEGIPYRIPYCDPEMKCTILTTSSSWTLEDNLSQKEVDRKIQLFGVRKKETFGRHIVDYLNSITENQKDYSDFSNKIKDSYLEKLTATPIMLKHLICLWFYDQPFGKSSADVYTNLIELMLQQAENEKGVSVTEVSALNSEVATPTIFVNGGMCDKYKSLLASLGKISFEAVCSDNGQLAFKQFEGIPHGLCEMDVSVALRVGLFSKDYIDQDSLSFSHKTFQDYFAALWVALNPSEVKSIYGMFASVNDILRHGNMLMFLSGMRPSTMTRLYQDVVNIINNDERLTAYRNLYSENTEDDWYTRERLLLDIEQSLLSLCDQNKSAFPVSDAEEGCQVVTGEADEQLDDSEKGVPEHTDRGDTHGEADEKLDESEKGVPEHTDRRDTHGEADEQLDESGKGVPEHTDRGDTHGEADEKLDESEKGVPEHTDRGDTHVSSLRRLKVMDEHAVDIKSEDQSIEIGRITAKDTAVRNYLKIGFGLIELQKGMYPFIERVLYYVHDSVLLQITEPYCGFCTSPYGKGKCPTGKCDEMYAIIYRMHRLGRPQMRNVDLSKTYHSHWEFAKCFLPDVGYTNVNSPAECDTNGLLSIVINCTKVADFLGANIDHETKTDIFHEVIAIRNSFIHTTLNLETIDTASACDRMVEILCHFRADWHTRFAVHNICGLRDHFSVSRWMTEDIESKTKEMKDDVEMKKTVDEDTEFINDKEAVVMFIKKLPLGQRELLLTQ